MLSSRSPDSTDGSGARLEYNSHAQSSVGRGIAAPLQRLMQRSEHGSASGGASLMQHESYLRLPAGPSAPHASAFSGPWRDLTPPQKLSAMALGFNAGSWEGDPDGAPPMLSEHWHELEDVCQIAAQNFGFSQPMWDTQAALRRRVARLNTDVFSAQYNERAARNAASEQRSGNKALKCKMEAWVASLRGDSESVFELGELDKLVPSDPEQHAEREHDQGRVEQVDARGKEHINTRGALESVTSWLAAKARSVPCPCLE